MTHLEAYLGAIGLILFAGVILAGRQLEKIERELRKANAYLRHLSILAHAAHERAEGRSTYSDNHVWWDDPAEGI